LEKDQNLKKSEEKMEEIKCQLKAMKKKADELQNAEALTKWKFVNYNTTIESLKTKERELVDQINEIKKTNHSKEAKITRNIHVQEEITEEMNSYRVRYEKQYKELQEARKEILRFKNNYDMTSQSLTRLTSKYRNIEQRLNNNQKENVLKDMSQKINDMEKTIDDLKYMNQTVLRQKD